MDCYFQHSNCAPTQMTGYNPEMISHFIVLKSYKTDACEGLFLLFTKKVMFLEIMLFFNLLLDLFLSTNF